MRIWTQTNDKILPLQSQFTTTTARPTTISTFIITIYKSLFTNFFCFFFLLKTHIINTSSKNDNCYTHTSSFHRVPKSWIKREKTSSEPSTTTSRRRLFDSDEDFSQTPPNFLWGSFRGENYKL